MNYVYILRVFDEKFRCLMKANVYSGEMQGMSVW